MEDVLSYKSSSESMSTSGEFEIVAEGATAAVAKGEKKRAVVGSLPLDCAAEKGNINNKSTCLLATSPPTLNIANNGDMLDLEQNLKEMIREIEKSPIESDSTSSVGKWMYIHRCIDSFILIPV